MSLRYKLRAVVVDVVSYAYVFLFFYTAFDKWLKFDDFQKAMKVQVIPEFMIPLIIYLLPPVEILSALLLMFRRSMKWGLYISTGLMAVFTLYVGLAVVGAYKSVPCACGGVISTWHWNEHLIFNSIFLIAGLVAIQFYRINSKNNSSLALG